MTRGARPGQDEPLDVSEDPDKEPRTMNKVALTSEPDQPDPQAAPGETNPNAQEERWDPHRILGLRVPKGYVPSAADTALLSEPEPELSAQEKKQRERAAEALYLEVTGKRWKRIKTPVPAPPVSLPPALEKRTRETPYYVLALPPGWVQSRDLRDGFNNAHQEELGSRLATVQQETAAGFMYVPSPAEEEACRQIAGYNMLDAGVAVERRKIAAQLEGARIEKEERDRDPAWQAHRAFIAEIRNASEARAAKEAEEAAVREAEQKAERQQHDDCEHERRELGKMMRNLGGLEVYRQYIAGYLAQVREHGCSVRPSVGALKYAALQELQSLQVSVYLGEMRDDENQEEAAWFREAIEAVNKSVAPILLNDRDAERVLQFLQKPGRRVETRKMQQHLNLSSEKIRASLQMLHVSGYLVFDPAGGYVLAETTP